MRLIRPVTDFLAPELDIFARMTEGQLLNRAEPEKGIFIAESPLVIGRALDGGCVPICFLCEPKHLEQQKPLLERCPETPIYTAEIAVISQLTGYPMTRGMLCAMRRPLRQSPEDLCRKARRIAVLEDVMNPTNVGAIFRSAAALGIDAVLLTHGSSDPLYRRAIRVSMGTVFQVPWTFFESGLNWQESLHDWGYKTVAMALRQDSLPIWDEGLRKENRLAIVLGTEGEGLMDGTISACDYTVRIPMTHGVDSLNVAAASAVAFYQLALID